MDDSSDSFSLNAFQQDDEYSRGVAADDSEAAEASRYAMSDADQPMSTFSVADLLNDVDWILSLGVQLQNCTSKFHTFEEYEAVQKRLLERKRQAKGSVDPPRSQKSKTHKNTTDSTNAENASSDSDSDEDTMELDDDNSQQPNIDDQNSMEHSTLTSDDKEGTVQPINSKPSTKKRPYVKKDPYNITTKYRVNKKQADEKHAEDHWIYRPLLDGSQSRGATLFSWPFPQSDAFQSIQEMDSYYEDEYGDPFLSPDWNLHETENPSSPCNVSSSFKYKSLIPQPSNTPTQNPQDTLMDTILNDMIQQAWDRAVHLADSVLSCDLISSSSSTPQDSVADNNRSMKTSIDDLEDMLVPCSPEKYIDTDGVTWFQCKTCTSPAFLSEEAWTTHFYSHTDDSYTVQGKDEEEGCGIRLFKKRQVDMVQKILSKEAMFTIDGILHVLFTQLKMMIQKGQLKTHGNEFLKWQDIIQIFQQSIHDDNRQWREDRVYESLLVHPDFVPIPLNHHIITTAKVRLVERYVKFDLNLRNQHHNKQKKKTQATKSVDK